MSDQLLFNSWMTFVWIRLLEDIYIVKEIAGKCHKELTGFDRALRNAAFFVLAGILAFWGLKVKWISLICLHAGCSPGRSARNSDSYCCFCQMGFLWRRRGEEKGRLSASGGHKWSCFHFERSPRQSSLSIKVSANISKQLMSLYQYTDYLPPSD